MRFNPAAAVACLILSQVAQPPFAHSQVQPGDSGVGLPISAPSAFVGARLSQAPSSEPVFDLHFGGGPVRDFLEVVAEASENPVNVIVNPELEDTPIPPMKLRGVTLPSVFEAVASASMRTSEVLDPRTGQTRRARYTCGFRPSDGTRSVWVFFREDPPLGPPAEEPQPQVRVLNLSTYLSGRSVEDVTSAIRIACDMLESEPQPRLTFHKETQLLIARGWPEQLDLIQQVLQQLAAAPPPSEKAASRPAYQMSPELMRRYGLGPAADAPAPAPESPPR